MMYRYDGSTCLKDPVSRSRGWGQDAPAEESLRAELDGGFNSLATEEEIRHDLVARVRREIAAGIYDTQERLEIALERLLDRFDLS